MHLIFDDELDEEPKYEMRCLSWVGDNGVQCSLPTGHQDGAHVYRKDYGKAGVFEVSWGWRTAK